MGIVDAIVPVVVLSLAYVLLFLAHHAHAPLPRDHHKPGAEREADAKGYGGC